MSNTDDFELGTFLPYILNQAAEVSSLEFQSYYKAHYSMLRTEWRVLFHLGQYGDMPAKEICKRAKIHKTKVSRAVAALEQKRFLTRTPYEHDKRHENLALTKHGIAAFDDLYRQARKFDAALVKTFSAREEAILRKCLIRIAKL